MTTDPRQRARRRASIRTHGRTVRPRFSQGAILGLPAWPAVDRTRRCRPRLRSVDGISPYRAGDRRYCTIADQWATARRSAGKRRFGNSESGMRSLAPGAHRLPTHHITIRVPWHDSGWSGSVCTHPLANTSCLILPRIGEGKRDDVEARCAGQRLDQLEAGDLPPCAGERVSFMAPFDLTRIMHHPYAETSPETHGHFAPTRFVQASHSAACVPFRWMLRGQVEGDPKKKEPGLAEQMKLAILALFSAGIFVAHAVDAYRAP
jgi:hypothetical protein